jgi:hypothetical protein
MENEVSNNSSVCSHFTRNDNSGVRLTVLESLWRYSYHANHFLYYHNQNGYAETLKEVLVNEAASLY